VLVLVFVPLVRVRVRVRVRLDVERAAGWMLEKTPIATSFTDGFRTVATVWTRREAAGNALTKKWQNEPIVISLTESAARSRARAQVRAVICRGALLGSNAATDRISVAG
jgi:hypothetical protein